MTAPLRSQYHDTLATSRLALHMARGDDGIWHAWLYDPATDEIIATAVQDKHHCLACLVREDILPTIADY